MPRAVLVALCVLTTAALGLTYAGDGRAGDVDRAAQSALDHWLGAHQGPLEVLADLGNLPVVVAGALLLALAAHRGGRRRLAVLALVAPVVVAVATWSVKLLAGRTGEYGLVFPSGHTALVTTLALMAVLLDRRWALLAVPLLPAVAAALVVQGYHYATDTLGGFCLAAAIVLALDGAWSGRAGSGRQPLQQGGRAERGDAGG